MRKLLSFALFMSVVLNCRAQDKDLMMLSYGISGLKHRDTIAQSRQLDLKIRFPLYRKNKNTFVGTVGYKHVGLTEFPENYPQNLHSIVLQTAWMHVFNTKKSLTLFAQAGLFSDMKDISSEDFRYTVGIRYRVKHSNRLSTGWGIAYSRQFFGNQIIPFIDVSYEANGKWSVSGQFPVKPKVLYHFCRKLSAGIEINGEAGSYRLSATERDNRFLQINQWKGLAILEYQVARLWQCSIGIGGNFKQSYKLYPDAASTPWTIITIPFGNRDEPIYKLENKGWSLVLGISMKAF